MKKFKIIITIFLIAVFTLGVITVISSRGKRKELNKTYVDAAPTYEPTKAPIPEPTPKTTSKELPEVTVTPSATIETTPTPLPAESPTHIPTKTPIQSIIEAEPKPAEPEPIHEPIISDEAASPDITPVPTPTEITTIEPTPLPEPVSVSVNQFISNLMIGLNPTVEDPINKAIEEGIIAPLQFNDSELLEPITNNDMAKIAAAALGDIDYPDYLKAYEGLIEDKDDIKPMYREDILKAIYAGVISVDSGVVKPESYCKSNDTEKIIEKILNPDKRDTINFAIPDSEFEKFMVSPEAENYVTLENIFKVIDGKLIYDSNDVWGNYSYSLLPTYHNPDSNKVAYELLKGLVTTARKYEHYVAAFYNKTANAVLFCYYDSKEFFQAHTDFSGSMFTIHIVLSPKKYAYEAQNEYTNYIWEVHSLFDPDIFWEGIMPEDINFQQDEFKEVLSAAFKAVYGDSLGEKLYDYTINEYNQESNYTLEGQEYMNTTISYFDEFDGLEIVNNNQNGSSIIFATNMVKGEQK